MQSTSDAEAEVLPAFAMAIVIPEGCFELIELITGAPAIVPARLQLTV